MIYLSKGIVQKGSTEQLLFVLYGGQKFELTGNAAAAWLNGRFNFAEALGCNETPVIYLQRLGLAETKRTMTSFPVIGLHPGASSARQTLPSQWCSGLWIKNYCSG